MADLRAVADLVRLLVFLAFMFLALRAARAMRRSERERSQAVGTFVAFTVLVSMGVGAAQHAAWPFSHWPMDNKYFEAETTGLLAFVVDARGDEHELDFRALYPLDWMDHVGILVTMQIFYVGVFHLLLFVNWSWIAERFAGLRLAARPATPV